MLIYQYFALVKLYYSTYVSYFVIVTFGNRVLISDTKHLQLITHVTALLK
jgi:hypothetical protein